MMKRTAIGCWFAAAAVIFLLVSFSQAHARGWTIHQDGRLTVDGSTYAGFSHYFSSDAFKQSGRRCGTVSPSVRFEPDGGPSDCGANQSANLDDYAPAQIYEIPVVVHIIIRSDGVGNISDSRVQSQIDILNEDFMAILGTPGENGTISGVRFRLASVDPSGNPTSGITRTTNDNWFQDNDEYGFKSALGWDRSRYLNIYTNSAGGYLGYAYLPQSDAGSVWDGVVILYSAFGRDSGNPPYDQGRTTTHEVGHYLGLEHTFEGGCQTATPPGCYSSGDLICDTNSEQSPVFGCPSASVTCNSPDPIHNYMDYTDDTCMTNYTPEQARRLRCALENYRPVLYTVTTGLVADFTANATQGAAPLTVNFTDLTTDAVTSWFWTFGDGGTSSAQNPLHTYTAAGQYTVALTVNGPSGSDIVTKPGYITLTESPAKRLLGPAILLPLLLKQDPQPLSREKQSKRIDGPIVPGN
ncbi:MAG: PKD domain-containing protein [Deltaproteobacteria bacterium]|nr:PKD domain-containing protein [Deltaproteobacteria bacterium]